MDRKMEDIGEKNCSVVSDRLLALLLVFLRGVEEKGALIGWYFVVRWWCYVW
jgi:hypothetical protein